MYGNSFGLILTGLIVKLRPICFHFGLGPKWFNCILWFYVLLVWFKLLILWRSTLFCFIFLIFIYLFLILCHTSQATIHSMNKDYLCYYHQHQHQHTRTITTLAIARTSSWTLCAFHEYVVLQPSSYVHSAADESVIWWPAWVRKLFVLTMHQHARTKSTTAVKKMVFPGIAG